MRKIRYYDNKELLDLLIGQSVVGASMENATLTLSNGTSLRFDLSNSDCCSWVELTCLRGTDNIITEAKFQSKYEDGYEYEGAYKTRLHVLTADGPVDIAEAEGNASNGYYLKGFALDVTVIPPEGEWLDD